MNLSRRRAISLIAGVSGILGSRRSLARELMRDGHPEAQSAGAVQLEIAPGPFKGTRESLREWQVPDWYRDAKFGIWAHWGPQSGVEDGDWYARNMYIQGNKQYEYHVK